MERQLDERSRAILDVERGWWQGPGPKDRAIRARFGHSPARYYQLLNHLIDSPDAMAYDPMLVKRLRRPPGGAAEAAVRPRSWCGAVARRRIDWQA
jgi:hypothetical protein